MCLWVESFRPQLGRFQQRCRLSLKADWQSVCLLQSQKRLWASWTWQPVSGQKKNNANHWESHNWSVGRILLSFVTLKEQMLNDQRKSFPTKQKHEVCFIVQQVQCFYLKLDPTGQFFSFSIGYYATEAISTINIITIWPSVEETLQIL